MFRFNARPFESIRRSDYLALEVFHTGEAAAVLAALPWGVSPQAQQVFWGVCLHPAVGVVYLWLHGAPRARA